LTGNKHGQSWTSAEEKSSIFELKAYIENILKRLGFNLRKLVVGEYTDDLLSEALTIYSKSGQKLAVYGIVQPAILKVADIDEEVVGHPINVCIIGQPNVGKSSLLNSILGYERVIVSPIPHTTREPQHTEIIYQGQRIRFVDTAGISKQGHKGESLAKEGIAKSLKILKKADIALLVLDINSGITHQDAKIVEEIMESRKSFMILANKWDLVEPKDTKTWTNYVYRYLPFATWAPLQFISAKTGAKVDKIMNLIVDMNEARHREVSDSQLDKFLNRIVKIHLPTRGKGSKKPRLYEIRQSGVRPPRFEVRIGAKEDLDYSYLRFIENQLRIQFDLTGIPIRVRVIKRSLLPAEIKAQKELKKQPKTA